MELKIYDKQGLVKMVVSPDGSSQWNHEIGVENVVTVNFTTWEYFVMEVGFYILVEGVQFRLKSEYKPKHVDNRKYTYNLKFYGREHDMQDILFCRLNQSDDDFESVFAYDCTPMELLQKVVDNMNRNSDGIVWKAGEAVPANRKTINFNGLYCWDALSEGARAFETEWWMDGEYLNLSKCLRGEYVSLGYGQGLRNGLTQNENSTSAKWFTRLIPVGSSRNIDRNKYGYSTLQLPGREKYIDINTQQGLKEYREESAFSEIYPHREGSISSVRSELKTNEETGDFTVWYVKDESLPFNPDEYMIPNEVIDMTFNTGSLAGKEFEVNWNADTREFEIINQYPDDNTQIPGGNLVPKSGDKYVLTNISMPDEYIKAAEEQYKEAVDLYIEEYAKDISIYSGNTDYIYVDKNNIPLQIGQRVVLISEQYFDSGRMESRITRLSRKLNNLGDASFDCSNAVSSTWKSNVDSSLNQLQFSVAQEMAKTIIDILKVGDSKEPSNYNVFSALRTLNTFLRKDKDDRSKGKIASDKGFEAGDFVNGATGVAIYKNSKGQWVVETDNLNVRRKFSANEVEIQSTEHIGGQSILTPARMIVELVDIMDDRYRCLFRKKDADGNIVRNQWKEGDLALCNTFNLELQADGTTGNHYYWREVVGVSDDSYSDEFHYVDLSIESGALGSSLPKVGDKVVQLGYCKDDDPDRQNAIIIAGAGVGSPYIQIFEGIHTFELPEPEQLKPGDNRLSGVLQIKAGSKGASNILDLPDEIFSNVKVGSVNLLKNSGFTGDYKSENLNGKTLSSSSPLYSNSLKYWSGNATILDDSIAISGKSALLGSISQSIDVINGESYVVSFKAKGENVSVKFGNVIENIPLTSLYKSYSVKYVSDGVGIFSIEGDATICNLQLERGTVATDWDVSPYDNDKAFTEFQALKYLQDAIKDGNTNILGGLILSSMIKLGNYKDGSMEKVNAGISGIYNDDNDVAFWGGGTFEEALQTIMKFKNNPNYAPSIEEWKDMANFVVSHGGDLFLHGNIYAENGYFRGEVNQNNGATLLKPDGSGQLANGALLWNKYGTMYRTSHENIVWVYVAEEFGESMNIDLTKGTYLNLTDGFWQPVYTLPNSEYDKVTLSIKWNFASRSNGCAVLSGNFMFSQKTDEGYSWVSATELTIDVSEKEFQLTFDSSKNAWLYYGDGATLEGDRIILGNIVESSTDVQASTVTANNFVSGGKNGLTTSFTISTGDAKHTLTFTSGLLTGYNADYTGGGN